MIKLASFALAGALGVAGLATSLPAAACPTVGVQVAYFPGPYRGYYGHERFWHRGYEHFDRFHHRWY